MARSSIVLTTASPHNGRMLVAASEATVAREGARCSPYPASRAQGQLRPQVSDSEAHLQKPTEPSHHGHRMSDRMPVKNEPHGARGVWRNLDLDLERTPTPTPPFSRVPR